MKRGELIESSTVACVLILTGRKLFHEKTCLSSSQLKTWTIGRIIEKVRERKLYEIKEN